MTQVSVLIAAYNAVNTLGAAIESALTQTDITCEIIVIDDSSTDNTHQFAQDYAARYPNIRVLQTPVNSGPSAARNIGIKAASGDWIAILDSDDTYNPDRLTKMISHGMREGADLIFDNMIVVEYDRETPFLNKPFPPEFSLTFFASNNLSYLSSPAIGYLKPVIRRAFLEENSLQYDATLSNSEDYLLIMEILARKGRCVYLPNTGYNYFVHGTSISAKFKKRENTAFIEAERKFLRRHEKILSASEQRAIRRHLHNRIVSEPVFYCIEAIKNKDVSTLIKVLTPHSWKERMSVLNILARVIFKKISGKSSRF